MKIVVVGIGYVGLANATLFAHNHEVKILDINEEKIKMVNNRVCPFVDSGITDVFNNKTINLKAEKLCDGVYKNADIVFIATPTNYDDKLNYFDTSSVESTIKQIYKENKNAIVVIKSTIPVGYTNKLARKYPDLHLYFSPEFLREGHAFIDVINPSRIIVGVKQKDKLNNEIATKIINLLTEQPVASGTPSFIMGYQEAEATKLFANTFLAMRVAYFNELDTYAEMKGLNTKDIIDGVSKDPRIGDFYNNPSFGYGGYCLPKDTKQLKANFANVPNQIISATVQANETRINFIATRIMELVKSYEKPVIGIYRLAMKSGSDNFRSSSIISIIERLKENGCDIVVFEPSINAKYFNDVLIENDLNEFKEKSSIIVTNRYSDDLDDVKDKIYTRDLYNRG